MLLTRKHISRRTLLRGLGTAMALPMLDAMCPAFATPKSPRRLAFAYVPNGIVMKHWTPAAEGTAFELPRILGSLEPFRENLLLLSGLAQHNGFALGDGPGDPAPGRKLIALLPELGDGRLLRRPGLAVLGAQRLHLVEVVRVRLTGERRGARRSELCGTAQEEGRHLCDVGRNGHRDRVGWRGRGRLEGAGS